MSRRSAMVATISIGVLVVILGVASWTIVLLRTTPSDDVSGSGLLSDQEMVEFADHPERFKGKTLRIYARLDSPIFSDRGDSLRNYGGHTIQFAASGPRGEVVAISVQSPALDLPNATYNDPLVVTFVCREGMTTRGNEAVSINRP